MEEGAARQARNICLACLTPFSWFVDENLARSRLFLCSDDNLLERPMSFLSADSELSECFTPFCADSDSLNCFQRAVWFEDECAYCSVSCSFFVLTAIVWSALCGLNALTTNCRTAKRRFSELSTKFRNTPHGCPDRKMKFHSLSRSFFLLTVMCRSAPCRFYALTPNMSECLTLFLLWQHLVGMLHAVSKCWQSNVGMLCAVFLFRTYCFGV